MPYKTPGKNRIASAQRYAANAESINEKRRLKYAADVEFREEQKKQARAWALAHPDARKDYEHIYRASESCRKRVRANYAIRCAVDPEFKITNNLRGRIRKAVRGFTKSASTIELIGCSPEALRAYLEAQFQPGMTWDNYGLKGWHVDHKKPCDSFDLNDPEQQRQCFHYTNLQPLWAIDNLKKGAK